jgi:hypothetical protein
MIGLAVLESAVEDLGEGEVLTAAAECARTARQAESRLLVLAYQWAVLHAPERLDPVSSGRAGRERSRQYGGDGTDPVTEFAAAELGARIGLSTYSAGRLIADAQDLHNRLPL